MVFMFKFLCEFAIIWKYDEMNCKFFFRVFYNVFWGVDSGYMNNHNHGVLMNGKVKCVENIGKNNECIHVKW
jgi:hypothetical protein